MNRVTRITEIYKRFRFGCNCDACSKNYPMLSQSDWLKTYMFIDSLKHYKLCVDYKIDAVKTLIPKYCDFLTVNSEKYPFNHTVVAEKLLYEFFKMAYTDVVPLAEKIRLQL